MQLKVVGPLPEITRLTHMMHQQPAPDVVSIGEPSEHTDLFGRPRQGMEPLVYFVVAFASHLSAAAAHDYLEHLITKVFGKHNDIKIDTPKDNKPE